MAETATVDEAAAAAQAWRPSCPPTNRQRWPWTAGWANWSRNAWPWAWRTNRCGHCHGNVTCPGGAPIADELRRGIEAGELDPSLDVEAMIDLINGLYYYQFVVRGGPSTDEETRSRVHAAVKLVWEGALRR